MVATVYGDASNDSVNAAIVVGDTTYVVTTSRYDAYQIVDHTTGIAVPDSDFLGIKWSQPGEQGNVEVPAVSLADRVDCTVLLGEDNSVMNRT